MGVGNACQYSTTAAVRGKVRCMTTNEAEPAEAETPGDIPEGSETAEEVQRRRFREALAKKNLGHHGEGMADKGGVQAAHTAPAAQKRVHRRKSG